MALVAVAKDVDTVMEEDALGAMMAKVTIMMM